MSYSLTESGREPIDVMERLTGWIARELDTVRAAQERHDRLNG